MGDGDNSVAFFLVCLVLPRRMPEDLEVSFGMRVSKDLEVSFSFSGVKKVVKRLKGVAWLWWCQRGCKKT